MTTRHIVDVICNIVGRANVSKKQRTMLNTLVDLIQQKPLIQYATSTAPGTKLEFTEPNKYTEDEDETSLDERIAFNLPNKINVKYDGMEDTHEVSLNPTPGV